MRYVKNLIVNGVPFALFMYGIMAGAQWALITGLVIYWIVIAGSIIAIKIPIEKFFEGKMSLNKLESSIDMISKAFDNNYNYLNVVQDIAIAFIFSYFGYNFLAIFYTLHIFGYLIFYWNIKQYVMQNFGGKAWGDLSEKLEQALRLGETEFSFYELAGKRDPSIDYATKYKNTKDTKDKE